MHSVEQMKNKFFGDCATIVRLPGSFYLSGDHSVEDGQPALALCINFWMTVGICPSESDDYTFEVWQANPSANLFYADKLNPENDYFHPEEVNEHLEKSLENIAKGLKYLRSKGIIRQSFHIKVWSEIPFAIGLNATSALSACLALIVLSQEKHWSGNQLLNCIDKFRCRKSLDLDLDADFTRIFALARWFDNLSVEFYRSGASIFASLMSTSEEQEIIVFFTEKRGFDSIRPLFIEDHSYERQMAEVADTRFWGTRIEMPGWMRSTYSMSLFYSGSPADSPAVLEDLRSWHFQKCAEVLTFLHERFGDDALDPNILAVPLRDILRDRPAANDADRWPRTVYASAMGTVTWRMLECLLQKDQNRASDFVDFLMDTNKLLKAYGVLRGHLRKFKRKFRQSLSQELQERIWTKLIGPGNGGDLIVFGEHHDLLEVHRQLIGMFDAQTGFRPILHSSTVRNHRYYPDPLPPVLTETTEQAQAGKPKSLPANGASSRGKSEPVLTSKALRISLVLNDGGSIRIQVREGSRLVVGTYIDSAKHVRLLKELVRQSRFGEIPFLSAWGVWTDILDHKREFEQEARTVKTRLDELLQDASSVGEKEKLIEEGKAFLDQKKLESIKPAERFIFGFRDSLKKKGIEPKLVIEAVRTPSPKLGGNAPKDCRSADLRGWRLCGGVTHRGFGDIWDPNRRDEASFD